MSILNALQYAVFVLIVALLVKRLGGYMSRVFNGGKTLLDPLLLPIERLIYRLTGVDAELELDWSQYASAFLEILHGFVI